MQSKFYKVDVTITNRGGECELVDKRFMFETLDEARNLDWNKIIDETEVAEKEEGLDIFAEHDETESFRETNNL